MIRINENYLKLKASYLFSDIAKRIKVYEEEHPDQPIIKLGIGDVTEPLPGVCLEAFHRAVDEMGIQESFRGYGPEQGYPFLREAIAAHEYGPLGVTVEADEVFVSDGAKCDTGNIQELFAQELRVAIPDPVYPVYVDTNVMAGRTGRNDGERYDGLVYLEGRRDNGYIPEVPKEEVDLIYLCFPNNPTGAVASREQLQAWVNYAREHRALILFDAAYAAFIRDGTLPQSIYEIEGARDVAIEFRSFSKNAGFTGTRCAFIVIPKELKAYDSAGGAHLVYDFWKRRHTTKFNGVSYPVQRAAAAIYSLEGQQQIRTLTDGYLANAQQIRQVMEGLGYHCSGGNNAPYVWIDTGENSWQFFDRLLKEAGVVCTPGAGFGACGEGHIRLSAFNSSAKVATALERIESTLKTKL